MKINKTKSQSFFLQNSGCSAIFSDDYGLIAVFLAYILIRVFLEEKIVPIFFKRKFWNKSFSHMFLIKCTHFVVDASLSALLR